MTTKATAIIDPRATVDQLFLVEEDSFDLDGAPIEQVAEPGETMAYLVHAPGLTLAAPLATVGTMAYQSEVEREAVESFVLTPENRSHVLAKSPDRTPALDIVGGAAAMVTVSGREIRAISGATFPLRVTATYRYTARRYLYTPPDDLDAVATETEWNIDVLFTYE